MKNNNKDAPGVGRETFKIVLDSSYFPTEMLNQQQLRVTSLPKPKYQQWYWRGLEFLTFGRRFNAGWEYTCEKVEK